MWKNNLKLWKVTTLDGFLQLYLLFYLLTKCTKSTFSEKTGYFGTSVLFGLFHLLKLEQACTSSKKFCAGLLMRYVWEQVILVVSYISSMSTDGEEAVGGQARDSLSSESVWHRMSRAESLNGSSSVTWIRRAFGHCFIGRCVPQISFFVPGGSILTY
jgi:hypothetical protein